jgi:hypothetical protein
VEHLGRIAAAESLYAEAVALAAETVGTDHASWIRAFEAQAEFLERQGRGVAGSGAGSR